MEFYMMPDLNIWGVLFWGVFLRIFWEIGASWGFLGASWWLPGIFLGTSWGLLGALSGHLGIIYVRKAPRKPLGSQEKKSVQKKILTLKKMALGKFLTTVLEKTCWTNKCSIKCILLWCPLEKSCIVNLIFICFLPVDKNVGFFSFYSHWRLP